MDSLLPLNMIKMVKKMMTWELEIHLTGILEYLKLLCRPNDEGTMNSYLMHQH
jgi:hypothetical protein